MRLAPERSTDKHFEKQLLTSKSGIFKESAATLGEGGGGVDLWLDYYIVYFLNINTGMKYMYTSNTDRFYTLQRMALPFALIKQMLKLENRSKEACDFGKNII